MAIHIGAICDPSPSHIAGMASIGRELQSRGHRFTIFQSAAIAERVAQEGVDFEPLAGVEESFTAEFLKKARHQENLSLKLLHEYGLASTKLICERGPAVLKAAGLDLLLVDQGEPAAGSVAELVGLPFVNVSIALPYNAEPDVPPFFMPWPYRRSFWSRLRNRAGYAARDLAVRPMRLALNKYRREWGLRPHRNFDQTFSNLAQITQLIAELDFPRRALPECFHYVGPYRRGRESQVTFDFSRLDGRPVVYASLGTILSGSDGLWQTIIDACANVNVQLVLSLGGLGRVEDFKDARGDPVVVDFAPQVELLRLSKAVITPAGINTVLESLTEAVPMVAIPITAEQPGVASRVRHSGSGVLVPSGERNVECLTAALNRVLKEPEFSRNATRLQAAVKRSGGAREAADVIERVVSTGAPVLRNGNEPLAGGGS